MTQATSSSPLPLAPAVGPRYKWLVLSNTTIGVLLSSLNASSLMIALPVIFRGIGLDPLSPANFPYLLWMMMGYMLVTAALVVTVGRIGDIFGRVRMYNIGFAWFTVASILLSCVWSTGATGAMELVIFRMVQAVGGALLFANSAAIITDAFPSEQLGFALGTNMMAAIVGGFLGILVGGVLSQAGWRWVFLANVPIGLFGTVWAYLRLKEIGVRVKARIDWLGNITFAGGLALLLTGVTYGIKPYGPSLTGWANPFVLDMIFGGLALLAVFVLVETKAKDPMFRLSLFRIKAFTAGNVAQFLGSVARGGFQFMLMIWLQGIWLPLHGYSYQRAPLWAGIYMVPFSVGFVVAGPLSGKLSDRYGARPFATGGMVLNAALFAAVLAFPANFSYPRFAVVMVLMGIAGARLLGYVRSLCIAGHELGLVLVRAFWRAQVELYPFEPRFETCPPPPRNPRPAPCAPIDSWSARPGDPASPHRCWGAMSRGQTGLSSDLPTRQAGQPGSRGGVLPVV